MLMYCTPFWTIKNEYPGLDSFRLRLLCADSGCLCAICARAVGSLCATCARVCAQRVRDWCAVRARERVQAVNFRKFRALVRGGGFPRRTFFTFMVPAKVVRGSQHRNALTLHSEKARKMHNEHTSQAKSGFVSARESQGAI